MASLFDKAPPEGYLEDWTRHLATAPEEVQSHQLPILVFRLGGESWALELDHCLEVLPPGRSHSLPHPRRDVLRGLAGVRGRLDLLVSLGPLLGCEASEQPEFWLVFGLGQSRRYVTSVDRITGVLSLDRDKLEVAPPGTAHIQGIWRNISPHVALLKLDTLVPELDELVGR